MVEVVEVHHVRLVEVVDVHRAALVVTTCHARLVEAVEVQSWTNKHDNFSHPIIHT